MAANTQPPGPKTGFRHPKCYAADDGNCSGKLSLEHYISASLLRQIAPDGAVKISGLHWQEAEQFASLPIGAIGARILCSRHNSALAPLDAAIDQFAAAIGEFDSMARPLAGDLSVREERRVLSGEDIERWLLKCLVGMDAAGALKNRVKAECLKLLFDQVPWPEGWGLYWQHRPDNTVYHSKSFAFATGAHPVNGEILTFAAVVRGVRLVLVMGRPDHPTAFGIRRPSAFVFRCANIELIANLRWMDGGDSQAVFLDWRGTYDGSPPDWKDWEKIG